MAKAPSFQWYPKDCDTDERVRAMDDREFGFYMRCLNHAWLNDGLPGELEEISRVLNRPRPLVEKLWPRVGRCFELRGDRYVNTKQETQRKEVIEFVESRRNAAASRWDKHKQCKNDARALQVECPASASPSASATATTEPNPKPHAAADADALRVVRPRKGKRSTEEIRKALGPRHEWWLQFWAVYPCKDGMNRGMDAFDRRVTTLEMFGAVLAGAKAYATKAASNPELSLKYVQGWLNDERWTDQGIDARASPPKSIYYEVPKEEMLWDGLAPGIPGYEEKYGKPL